MLFIILLFVIKLNSNFKEQLKNFPNLKPTLTMVRIQYMRSTHRWSQIGQEGSGGYCIPPMHQDAFYVTKVGVLPIWIVKSNILSVGRRQRETGETLDFTIHIGNTPIFSYLDLYLYSAYAANNVYCILCRPLH